MHGAEAVSASPAYDVIVVGGGNAGLVAAITATERVSRVLLLERAPAALRGGNTRHTRNVRCVHDTGYAYTPGSTWNGCPPHFTVQDGVCKPYRGY